MHQLSKRPNRRTAGFTLIELLFAMSFISVLLIVILMSTIQMTRIYNKGITLKQVNQSGTDIGNELQSSLKAANAPISTAAITNGDSSGGRLCLGTYSYVWNLKGAVTNKYTGDSTPIGLVKVNDPTGAMCSGTPTVPKAQSTELLLGTAGSSGVQLQLRDLTVAQEANSGQNYVYHVSYTVATADSDNSLLSATTATCKGGASDEFCALNSFDFSVFAKKGGDGSV